MGSMVQHVSDLVCRLFIILIVYRRAKLCCQEKPKLLLQFLDLWKFA